MLEKRLPPFRSESNQTRRIQYNVPFISHIHHFQVIVIAVAVAIAIAIRIDFLFLSTCKLMDRMHVQTR